MTSGWGAEARKSGGLVGRESRLFAGLLVALLGYAGWVVLTGYVVGPSATGRTLGTVRGTAVAVPVVVLTVAWLGLPAILAPVLVDRYLRNRSGNRPPNPYRLVAHPILLLWPPGIAVAVAGVVMTRAGPGLPTVALVTAAVLYLVVRTVAYGYRVYSLSRPLLLWVVTGLATASAVGGLLAAAPGAASAVPIPVGPTVETWQSVAGSRSLAVAGPVTAVALVGGYVVLQTGAGVVTRLRAPIDDPDKRAGQRYPPGSKPAATAETPTDGVDDTPDDSSQTRVFQGGGSTGGADPERQATTGPSTPVEDEARADPTPPASGEPVAERSGPDAQAAESDDGGTAPEAGDSASGAGSSADGGDGSVDGTDNWEADTAVFTPDDADGSDHHVCGDCGAQLADGTARFCSNCGTQIRE